MIKKSTDKDLHGLNTFGMRVKAALYVEYDSPSDLAALPWENLPKPVLPVGGGSNLLFTGDFAGTVLRSCITGITVLHERCGGDDVYVHVGAGVEMDEFCHWAAGKGLWGVENLSAIPGSAGASAVQNVGAYGVEAGELIDSVECYECATGAFVTIPGADCDFAYRDSFFKHNRGKYIVTGVVFHLYSDFRPRLDYGHLKEEVERNVELSRPTSDPYMPVLGGFAPVPAMPLTPMLVRDTVKAIRESKLPDPKKVGSAGSFFKNPVVSAECFACVEAVARARRGEGTSVPHYDLPDGSVKIPAAWMIDFCGFKGAQCGGAAVWKSQPLVIVNATGKATPQDVLDLEKKIIDTVRDTFSVTLSPEVDHIN